MTNSAYAKNNGDGLLYSILWSNWDHSSHMKLIKVQHLIVSIYQIDLTSFSEDGRGVKWLRN